MFRYRKQLTLGLVVVLILSLAASLFSGVVTSGEDEPTIVACDEAVSREIRTLVQNQAFAFRSQNVSAAYSYFSKNFQDDVDIERFSLIVGTNYPMLLSGTSLAFGECRVVDFGFAQAVTVTADDGPHALLYFLTDTSAAGEKASIAVEGITVENR